MGNGSQGPTEPGDKLVGQTLGSYRVERLLGSGGMGQVFLAIQPQIGSRVAVKVLSQECAQDQTLVERFFNEARAVNVIQHDGIVSVLDLSTLPDGRPYIVMEFLDGASVAELILEGPLSLDLLLSISLQTLDALQAAHAKHVVHRDLKPENLMVTQGGRLKVLDFGIAKLVPDGIGPVTALTQTGVLLGTPAYMAPEQILGGAVDARTDIYSMGVILFECATGQKPFSGRTLYELFDRQLKAAPPSPSSLRAGLPSSHEAVILKALAKRPEDRFRSAREMAVALRAAAAEPEIDLGQPASETPVRTAAPSAVTKTLPRAPAPGTTAGLDPTLPPGSGPVSAAATRRSRRGVWLGLLAAGVLVTGGLTAAGIVVLRDCGAIIAEDAPSPGRRAGTRKVITLGILKPDYDPRRFRPIKYLERARALAREVAEDMQLTTFTVDGVYPDGHADLTLRSDFTAIFGFRSPSLSRGDPTKPANLEQKLPCLVTVIASAHEVRAVRQVSPNGCREEILPPMRCTIAEAFTKAQAIAHDAGVPRGGNVVAGVVWWTDGWTLDFGSSIYAKVSEDCSRVE